MSSLLRLKLRNRRAFQRVLRNHGAVPFRPSISRPGAVAQAENFVRRAFDDAKVKLTGILNAAARHAENEARRLMRSGMPPGQAIKIAAREAAKKQLNSGMGCPPCRGN